MVEDFGRFSTREARDARIRQLRGLGSSMAQIATDVGMTKAGVQNALNRLTLEAHHAMQVEEARKRDDAYKIPAPPKVDNYRIYTIRTPGAESRTELRCTYSACEDQEDLGGFYGSGTPGVFASVLEDSTELELEYQTAVHNMRAHPRRAYVLSSAGWICLEDLAKLIAGTGE
jgi:hypothetical protein